MFGEKALELIKELQRSQGRTIPPYNEDVVRQVLEEMKILCEQNQAAVDSAMEGNEDLYLTITLRHVALARNRRCLLAYLYNRLLMIRQMRWDIGSVIPAETKTNLSEPEIAWFSKYSKLLASYMRSIGDYEGIDLTQDTKPPKGLYIEVRCVVDYGEFEAHDGSTILLSKNSQHFLTRSECEPLIRQGVLEHIVN